VPFARAGSQFTRDFEGLVAWLATRTDKSTIRRMLRIDWDTVGRIIERVCDEELDPDRLEDLYDIGVDEVSWKRQHNYLTLVACHQRRQIVWGCEGKGQAAADRFFEELNQPPGERALGLSPPPAIMTAAAPGASVPIDAGAQDAWLLDGEELEPQVLARAGKLRAVSMDMTGGYAKSVRTNAPQATICIDPYHVVQLANQALDEVRRSYWNELRSLGDQNAAKRFKDARWSLLKKPEKLTDTQASTLSRLKSAGGQVWRAYTLKERHRPDRPAPLTPVPQPACTIYQARQNDPQTPRRDPRRDPPRHQPRPHRSTQQQGPAHHQTRLRLPQRQSRARARSAHLRPDHPSPPTRTTHRPDHMTPDHIHAERARIVVPGSHCLR
jgi:transposase